MRRPVFGEAILLILARTPQSEDMQEVSSKARALP